MISCTIILLLLLKSNLTHSSQSYDNDQCNVSQGVGASTLCPGGCYYMEKSMSKSHSNNELLEQTSMTKYDFSDNELPGTRLDDRVDGIACQVVPYGYYSPPADNKMYICPAGSYSKSRSSNCTLCSLGTYSFRNASGSCFDCPMGQSTVRAGSTYCSKCFDIPDFPITSPDVSISNESGSDPISHHNHDDYFGSKRRCFVTDRPSSEPPLSLPTQRPSSVPSHNAFESPSINTSNRTEMTPSTEPSLSLVPTISIFPSNDQESESKPLPSSPDTSTLIPEQIHFTSYPIMEPSSTPLSESQKNKTGLHSVLHSNGTSVFKNTSKPTNATDDEFHDEYERERHIIEKRKKTIALLVKFSVCLVIIGFAGLIAGWYKKQYRTGPKMARIKLEFLLQRAVPHPPPLTGESDENEDNNCHNDSSNGNDDDSSTSSLLVVEEGLSSASTNSNRNSKFKTF